jgi:hypothetical protein
VTRTEYDGAVTVLADSFEGKHSRDRVEPVDVLRQFGLGPLALVVAEDAEGRVAATPATARAVSSPASMAGGG